MKHLLCNLQAIHLDGKLIMAGTRSAVDQIGARHWPIDLENGPREQRPLATSRFSTLYGRTDMVHIDVPFRTGLRWATKTFV